MKDFLFQMPRTIEMGYGKSRQIASFVKKMGLKNVLLVVDHQLKKLGLLDNIFNSLNDGAVAFHVFDDITHEPTIADVDQAIKDLKVGTVFDGVIGVGGGSAIDVAKLLAVSGGFEGSVGQYVGTNIVKQPGVPMMILPTTSGTGAEATPNAIVHNVEAEVKQGVVSPYLIPDIVILDPELTLSLPPKVTAETGLDAFTHAIECFICNKATPMSDMVSLESMRLMTKYLRQAVNNGQDREARYCTALGSLYGGIAIANSGTGGVHALAYPLGGKYHITHGLSNAILLAEVMKFNAPAVPEKFVKVAEVMGIETAGRSQEEIVSSTVTAITDLVRDVGITIKNFEATDQVLSDLAQSAMTVQRLLQNNPRTITREDAENIYRASLRS